MSHLAWTLLSVALGGALGALARFGLSGWFNNHVQLHHTVHIGTLLVNILGSFAMGVLYVYILERELFSPHWRSVLMVGFLGAFTTFSSFSLEAINFYEYGHPWLALGYVMASVLLCIGGAWGAMALTRGLI